MLSFNGIYFNCRILLAMPFYVLITSQAVNYMASRHRSPAEFAITALAVLGALTLREHWLRRRRLEQETSPGD